MSGLPLGGKHVKNLLMWSLEELVRVKNSQTLIRYRNTFGNKLGVKAKNMSDSSFNEFLFFRASSCDVNSLSQSAPNETHKVKTSERVQPIIIVYNEKCLQ